MCPSLRSATRMSRRWTVAAIRRHRNEGARIRRALRIQLRWPVTQATTNVHDARWAGCVDTKNEPRRKPKAGLGLQPGVIQRSTAASRRNFSRDELRLMHAEGTFRTIRKLH